MNTPEKLAIVTGGGSGIGRGCAQALLADGYRVVCCGLDQDADWPDAIEFVRIDVTDEQAVNAFAARVSSVAALVNCAGMILHEGKEFSAEGFRRVIDVNLVGTQLVTVALRQALAAARGAVVNLASVWSFFGSPRNPAYAASKGAVVQITRSHAVAFAAEGIRVNAVAPGWIDTRLAAGAIRNPERSAAIMARIPRGRVPRIREGPLRHRRRHRRGRRLRHCLKMRTKLPRYSVARRAGRVELANGCVVQSKFGRTQQILQLLE